MGNKIGVRLKIDVTKIDKARLFKGNKGTYLDATVFIDPDNANEYGDHGMIVQELDKDSRDRGDKGAILGNAKVFWRDGNGQPAQQQSRPAQQPAQNQRPASPSFDDFDSDIPF